MPRKKEFPQIRSNLDSETALAQRHSPNGGLREIRRRNGVDVDGPPDIRPDFVNTVKRTRKQGEYTKTFESEFGS